MAASGGVEPPLSAVRGRRPSDRRRGRGTPGGSCARTFEVESRRADLLHHGGKIGSREGTRTPIPRVTTEFPTSWKTLLWSRRAESNRHLLFTKQRDCLYPTPAWRRCRSPPLGRTDRELSPSPGRSIAPIEFWRARQDLHLHKPALQAGAFLFDHAPVEEGGRVELPSPLAGRTV